MYHYFPRGRTELIELAIDYSRRWMRDQIDAIRAETPDDVVTGYVDIWRRVVEGTNFRAGCATTGAVTGARSDSALTGLVRQVRGVHGNAVLNDALSAVACRYYNEGQRRR